MKKKAIKSGKINKDVSYSSFNCFCSALGNYLCSRGVSKENVRLALDLQWQFFYCDVTNYSSENRIVGEYPHIYDENINMRLRLLTGYEFYKSQNKYMNLSDVDECIRKNGQAILLVNKKVVGETLKLNEFDESVTTILVKKSQQKECYEIYKPNFYGDTQYDDSGLMTKKQLCYARFEPVREYGVCGDLIVCEKTRNIKKIDKQQLIVMMLLQVIDGYLIHNYNQINNISKCWYGCEGMKIFSKNLLEWKKIYDKENLFNRIDFCAMGLIFVKRQRVTFFNILTDILSKTYISDDFFDEEEAKTRQEILDQWGDMRIYMRLVCFKKNTQGIDKISGYVQKLLKLECNYLKKLKACIRYKKC